MFRLYNTDTWVLMYDVYNQSKYEFRKSTDLENFTTVAATDVQVTFGPRHGTVIPITKTEMYALTAKGW